MMYNRTATHLPHTFSRFRRIRIDYDGFVFTLMFTMLFSYASCGVHLLWVGCLSSHLAVIERGIGSGYSTCIFSKNGRARFMVGFHGLGNSFVFFFFRIGME
jgi:hypothetical protein